MTFNGNSRLAFTKDHQFFQVVGAYSARCEETARSMGFRLEPVAEADSLTVQKELVANAAGIYSILGPFSIAIRFGPAGRLSSLSSVRPAVRFLHRE